MGEVLLLLFKISFFSLFRAWKRTRYTPLLKEEVFCNFCVFRSAFWLWQSHFRQTNTRQTHPVQSKTSIFNICSRHVRTQSPSCVSLLPSCPSCSPDTSPQHFPCSYQQPAGGTHNPQPRTLLPFAPRVPAATSWHGRSPAPQSRTPSLLGCLCSLHPWCLRNSSASSSPQHEAANCGCADAVLQSRQLARGFLLLLLWLWLLLVFYFFFFFSALQESRP